MNITSMVLIASGVIVGIFASFTGLGGGIIMIPILLYFGLTAQKAVGTSFLGIFIIAVSALIAHHRLANVDLKYGVLLGIGGIIGAQIGARLLENVSADSFKRMFALLLAGFAVYLFFKK